MKNRLFFLLTALFMVLCAGCSSVPVRMDTIDETVDPQEIDFTRGRPVSVTVHGYQLCLFIPISLNDRYERACQMLRGQAGKDYLGNVRIKESWTYLYIGTEYTTTIDAMAYPVKKDLGGKVD